MPCSAPPDRNPEPLTNLRVGWYNTIGAAEYLSWLEDPAHTRGVVSSILTSATIEKGDGVSLFAFRETPHSKDNIQKRRTHICA